MNNKQNDYVLDVPYTWHFFEQQSPVLLDALARKRSINRPPLSEGFTYCELGCGNGLTSNLLAAAIPQGEFYAIDFNQEHIDNARAFGKQGQLSNVHYLSCSFEDILTKKNELPAFDFITLHGVYSWVGEDIRQQVLAIIQQYLKPNGLVYLSYNPMPYWSDIVPMWRMMLSHTQDMQGSSLEKAQAGLDYLKALRDNGMLFFRNHPSASQFLDVLLERDIAFVAHEFCNNHLEPQYFIDVANTMQQLGLDYLDKVTQQDECQYLPQGLQTYVDQADTLVEAEKRHSLVNNEFFRRDIYIKHEDASQPIPAKTKADPSLSKLFVTSHYSAHQVHRLFPMYQDRRELRDAIYKLIMPLAFEGQHTIEQLCEDAALQAYSTDEITAAVQALIDAGHLHFAVTQSHLAQEIKVTKLRFTHVINQHALQQRLLLDEECSLASNVLGSAITLNLIEGLCLQALIARADDPVTFIQSKLKQDEQAASEHTSIQAQFNHFLKHILPVLVRHNIVISD